MKISFSCLSKEASSKMLEGLKARKLESLEAKAPE
jgi:hypothetical protein